MRNELCQPLASSTRSFFCVHDHKADATTSCVSMTSRVCMACAVLYAHVSKEPVLQLELPDFDITAHSDWCLRFKTLQRTICMHVGGVFLPTKSLQIHQIHQILQIQRSFSQNHKTSRNNHQSQSGATHSESMIKGHESRKT